MSSLRRPLAPGEIIGYVIFVAGILFIWLVVNRWADKWEYWAHDIPIFLLTTWIVAGCAHRFVRIYLLACAISAVASAFLFVIFVKAYANEMGGVVLIAYGFYAFLISLAVGLPFVLYRRAQQRPNHG